mmetsp:Transcript_8242/g.12420  ORF Transcript_8242/g.12420 Transcript_8242/m.12420 type:complete len:449 (-) Transcript_8242:33-1379(-)
MNQASVLVTKSENGSLGNLFHLLPPDILYHLIQFLDIPSVGVLAQTSKPESGSISELANSEATWLCIVNRRFNVFTSSRCVRSCRPKLYGGPTWKDAYRSLASSNRIPKMRVLFKKKTIFAKGAGYFMDLNQGCKTEARGEACHSNDTTAPCSSCSMTKVQTVSKAREEEAAVRKKRRDQFVSMWVMINHTEDCNLRFTSLLNDRTHLFGRHMSQVTADRRIINRLTPYIELQLAFQNTKSGFCNLIVDVSKTTVHMRCQNRQNDKSTFTQSIIRHGLLKPRIIYRSIGNEVLYQENGMKPNRRSFSSFYESGMRNSVLGDQITSHKLEKRSTSFHTLSSLASYPLSLRPFEFVIVSVNVPLTHYMNSQENIRFETDFLSRAISLSTPVTLQCDNDQCKTNDNKSQTIDNHALYSSMSSAKFSSEHDIWESYMQLPGNCLALTDRSSL